MSKLSFLVEIGNTVLRGGDGNPFVPREHGGTMNLSESAFIFVIVITLLIVGYGIAKMIWGED